MNFANGRIQVNNIFGLEESNSTVPPVINIGSGSYELCNLERGRNKMHKVPTVKFNGTS